MSEVTYHVPEIHCGACETSIRRALASLNGIAAVEVDLQGKRVLVRYEEPATNAVEIRHRIEGAGFEVV